MQTLTLNLEFRNFEGRRQNPYAWYAAASFFQKYSFAQCEPLFIYSFFVWRQAAEFSLSFFMLTIKSNILETIHQNYTKSNSKSNTHPKSAHPPVHMSVRRTPPPPPTTTSSSSSSSNIRSSNNNRNSKINNNNNSNSNNNNTKRWESC